MIDMSNLFSTTSDLSLTRELSIKSLEKNQFLNNHFIADLESKTIVRISMNKIDNVGNVETLFKKYWENLSLDFISLLLDEDQISVLVNLALIMEYGSKGKNSIVPANAYVGKSFNPDTLIAGKESIVLPKNEIKLSNFRRKPFISDFLKSGPFFIDCMLNLTTKNVVESYKIVQAYLTNSILYENIIRDVLIANENTLFSPIENSFLQNNRNYQEEKMVDFENSILVLTGYDWVTHTFNYDPPNDYYTFDFHKLKTYVTSNDLSFDITIKKDFISNHEVLSNRMAINRKIVKENIANEYSKYLFENLSKNYDYSDKHFKKWLFSKSASNPHLSNFFNIILSNRSDLVVALRTIPDPQKEKALMFWFESHGCHELQINFQLNFSPSEQPTIRLGRDKGLNIISYHDQILGLSEVAKNLESNFIDYRFNKMNLTSNSPDLNTTGLLGSFSDLFGTSIVLIGLDQITDALMSGGSTYLNQNTKSVLIPFWELDTIPDNLIHSIREFDLVLSPSRFIKESLETSAEINSEVIYLHPNIEELSAPDELPPDYFLTVFDFFSDYNRKNINGLIDAYLQAYAKNKSIPKLVIKSINAHFFPKVMIKLKIKASLCSNIVFLDKFLSLTEMENLYSGAFGFISLHRTEGLGLGLAKSMNLGKPCIATGYSGNMDFMDKDSSLLVDFNLVSTKTFYTSPYSRFEGNWADPDINHAADLILRLSIDKQFALKIGKLGKEKYKEFNQKTRIHNNSIVEKYIL